MTDPSDLPPILGLANKNSARDVKNLGAKYVLSTVPFFQAQIDFSCRDYTLAALYKMRYEALKRIAGTRTDLTGDPVGPRLKTSEIVAGEVSESASQVKRFMRLTELNPEILDLVDQGKIGLRPAVELSYLSRHEQDMLVEAMEYADCTPSHAQAIRLRAFSKDGTLGPHVIENVMNEEKPNQREKISLRYDDARKFIPSSIPYNKTGGYIMKALEFYQKHLERQKGDRGDR